MLHENHSNQCNKINYPKYENILDIKLAITHYDHYIEELNKY